MSEIMLPLPGLSPVNGKASSARFDGGALSSDAGLLALREVVLRLDVAGRLASTTRAIRRARCIVSRTSCASGCC